MGEFKAIFGQELVIAALVLFGFGFIFNLLTDHLQRLTKSYTAELVVIGVLITVLASGFVIGWPAVLALLILFAASGFWMVVGFWMRNAQDQERARQEARDLLKRDGD